MSKKFRNELLENKPEFNQVFTKLYSQGSIREFSEELISIINQDKTPIRVNHEPLAFKDIFHLDLNDGRCKVCAFELVMLLDKLGIYAEAVICKNDFFIGTTGSPNGGHWYVEMHQDNHILCIDTSLEIIGSQEAFKKLSHNSNLKDNYNNNINTHYNIDRLFKENPDLIDYYDEMVVTRHTH